MSVWFCRQSTRSRKQKKEVTEVLLVTNRVRRKNIFIRNNFIEEYIYNVKLVLVITSFLYIYNLHLFNTTCEDYYEHFKQYYLKDNAAILKLALVCTTHVCNANSKKVTNIYA